MYFPPEGFQQILLAVGDDQVSVLVETADVPRVEPAIDDGLSSGFIHLEVAPHDIRPADKDLPVVCNLDFDIRNDPPDGSETQAIGMVGAHDGRSLGQPVGLADSDAYCEEELSEVLCQRSGSRNEVTDTAS